MFMEKLIPQEEIFKLGMALKEKGIPYDLVKVGDGLSIVVPSWDDNYEWDATCQSGIPGFKNGKLAIIGTPITGLPDGEEIRGLTTEDILAEYLPKYLKQKEMEKENHD